MGWRQDGCMARRKEKNEKGRKKAKKERKERNRTNNNIISDQILTNSENYPKIL